VALSRSEVAETLGRSTDFVDALIDDGTLRAKRVRKTVFVIAADVWSMLGIGSIAYEPMSDEAELLLRRIA
jgi:excisionase family DNA binding protein